MKKLICLLLCGALMAACLAGCGKRDSDETSAKPTAPDTEAPKQTEAPATEAPATEAPATEAPATEAPDPTDGPAPVNTGLSTGEVKNLGFTEFDNQLIAWLKQNGLSGENFTVSPLSFKAALALAVLGAEGETQSQLLAAMGFETVEEVRDWYAAVLGGVDRFDAYFDSPLIEERGDAAYEVVNSVWKNQDLPGDFRPDYLSAVQEQMRAYCGSAEAAELAAAVNRWVDEKTRGLIPQLLSDAADSSAILVNALYLKAGWEDNFTKQGEDDFTAADGTTVTKTYMQITKEFCYYEDDDTQLVSVPLQGGMYMLFVLGDDTDLAAKLAKAEYQRVEVTVPMFDVETTLNQGELCGYLRDRGCVRMFGDQAEFDPMFTEPLFVGDIIQKAKVHIDEEGLEAAAATAVLMCGSAAYQDPPQPKIFRADRAFSFYVVNSLDAPELLFWGQIVH